jgi:hypothetical protein
MDKEGSGRLDSLGYRTCLEHVSYDYQEAECGKIVFIQVGIFRHWGKNIVVCRVKIMYCQFYQMSTEQDMPSQEASISKDLMQTPQC